MRFESYIIIPKTLCIREPKRDKRIRVKPSIKINKINKIKNKKKTTTTTLINKPKLACVLLKIIVQVCQSFDLNFDEIIFPENPNKIVQNKDKYFLEFNSIMESLISYHHIINYLNK